MEINGKKYVVVVDEGFYSWLDQILPLLPKDEQGDKVAGPVYLYKVDDICTIVSLQPLTLDELKKITTEEDTSDD